MDIKTENIAALALAAGKGTRMHSDRPKVLQKLLGEPMLAYVLAALKPLFDADIFIVAGHGADLLAQTFPNEKFILQNEQLGTGHALRVAFPDLLAAGFDYVLVINGDAPLAKTGTLAAFLEKAAGADVAFASINLEDAGSYGRVVRQNGNLAAIVEAKDYDAAIHGPDSGEVNAGIYLLKIAAVEPLLAEIGNDNKSGEYYITDLVGLALTHGLRAKAIPCGNDASLLGVNSPAELSRMEELLRQSQAERLLESGVLIHAPNLLRASPFASIEPGAEISGPCEISGHSIIRRGARVASHCVIRDSTVEAGAIVESFSHLEGAIVGPDAKVGPYTRLRPGAELEKNARAGNFVELKKAVLGSGAKANHLSYLGDAHIGAESNIGAGTITCNYDGKNKFQTRIGENAFIGSNTALVAPVSVGAGALVGAGSVITKDVPPNEMAIARGRQKNLPLRKKGE